MKIGSNNEWSEENRDTILSKVYMSAKHLYNGFSDPGLDSLKLCVAANPNRYLKCNDFLNSLKKVGE